MSRPVVMGIHAVGNMKAVNILAGGNLLLILPATWIMLKLGIDLEIVLIINIIPWLIEPIIEMILLNKYIGFPIMRFYKYVYGNVLSISLISYILTLLVHRAISNEIAAFFAACACFALATVSEIPVLIALYFDNVEFLTAFIVSLAIIPMQRRRSCDNSFLDKAA